MYREPSERAVFCIGRHGCRHEPEGHMAVWGGRGRVKYERVEWFSGGDPAIPQRSCGL